MLCILYVNAVGALLGVIGLLLERALPANFPRRSLWCVIVPSSVVIPGSYRFLHTFSVTDALPMHDAAWGQFNSIGADICQAAQWVSALLALWGLANVWRASYVVAKSESRHAVVDGVPVVVTDSLGPATVGVLRSSVLLPKWALALPGTQRQYVVRHEEEHRKAHDARVLLFASLPLLLMPWNLAMWWQLRRLSLAIEMDCDNRVVSALGNPNAYGDLLLKIAQAANRGPRLQPAFLGGIGSLERRLTALVAPEPLKHFQKLLLPAFACVLLILVVSMPHPMVGHASHTHAGVTFQQ